MIWLDPMIWLHPVAGALGASMLIWIGLQGLRARHQARYAPGARAVHRRYAPWVFGFVVGVAVVGSGSVVLLRPDLQLAGSWHFWVLWTVVILLTGSAFTSRRLAGSSNARKAHAWIGVAAMVGVAVGAALGLGMLPG